MTWLGGSSSNTIKMPKEIPYVPFLCSCVSLSAPVYLWLRGLHAGGQGAVSAPVLPTTAPTQLSSPPARREGKGRTVPPGTSQWWEACTSASSWVVERGGAVRCSGGEVQCGAVQWW